MQPNIPLGARHNHTALKVENNQSREKLELLSSLFSLSFSLLFFFSSPPNLFGPKSSGRHHLTTCHSPIGSLGFPYPLIHNFGFPFYQVVTHVTHGSHLDLCLTCSPFDAWLNVSPPNECQVSLVTPSASKSVKFRLSWNSTKFDVIARFRKTISTMESVSSTKI